MSRTPLHRRYRRSAGPILPAAQATPYYSGVRHLPDRSCVVPAMDRPASRHRTRYLSVRCQSHSPPPRADRIKDIAPPPAPSLQAQQIRRDDPHRHQEVGALQDPRASNDRMAHRHASKLWSRMGIPARLHRPLSRVAFSAVMPDETTRSAVAFLQSAVAYYQNFGVTIERVMTDNGPCYTSKVFRNLCTDLNICHICNRPHTPRTNGRLNDPYKPPLENGPMQPLIKPPCNDATRFQPSFIATIGIDCTVVSKSRYPSTDWTWTGTLIELPHLGLFPEFLAYVVDHFAS